LAKSQKKSSRRKTQAAVNAPSASLRSENCEMKSAVEMTPRGKRGKLKNQKRVSHSSHRAWKSGKNQERGFPHFHRAGGGLYPTQKGQDMKPKRNSS
jgi:hypothetical protein